MTILIAYGTIEGQTGKIAHYIEKLVEERGGKARLFNTSNETDAVSFDDVDQVILAGSVHERRHPKAFEVFLTAHQKEIDARRSLLLSVSLSAAFPEGQDDAQDYADEMKMRTELDPDEEILVAGAVKTRHYDYYATQVLKHVVLRGRNYDPTVQEFEFTDWEALGDGVCAFLESA